MRSSINRTACSGSGSRLTDLGTGFWTQRIDPKARVMIDPDSVQVRYHHYDGLPMARVVAKLLERLAQPAARTACQRTVTSDRPAPTRPLQSRRVDARHSPSR